jgi:hypothetical protein
MLDYFYLALAVAAGISLYKIVELSIKWYIKTSKKIEKISKEKDVNDLDGLDDL